MMPAEKYGHQKMGGIKMMLYDDPNLIEYRKDIEGWVYNGRYLGKDENLAREMVCTHKYCRNCGQPVLKHRLYCKICQAKKDKKKYETFNSEPWNGNGTPVAIYKTDIYFYSI